jgi:hypothetical protein
MQISLKRYLSKNNEQLSWGTSLGNHDWWKPWKKCINITSRAAADGTAAVAVIVLGQAVEFLAKYVEGAKASHPSASDFVHYGNVAVVWYSWNSWISAFKMVVQRWKLILFFLL